MKKATFVIGFSIVFGSSTLVAATDPRTIAEIERRVDASDVSMMQLLTRWKNAEKVLGKLEEAKAPEFAITKASGDSARARIELEDALRKKDTSITTKVSPSATLDAPASRNKNDKGEPQEFVTDDDLKTWDDKLQFFASKIDVGDEWGKAKVVQLERAVSKIKLYRKNGRGGSLGLAVKDATRIVAELDVRMAKVKAESSAREAKELEIQEATLDSGRIALLGATVSVTMPVRAPHLEDSVGEILRSSRKIREAFWDEKIYRIGISYRSSRDTHLPTELKFSDVMPSLKLPSGEVINPINISDETRRLFHALSLDLSSKGDKRGVVQPSSPLRDGQQLLVVFKIPYDTPIQACSLIVRDAGSRQKGVVKLVKKYHAGEKGAIEECERGLTAIWDQIARSILQERLFTDSNDMLFNLARLCTLGRYFTEVYAEWKELAETVSAQIEGAAINYYKEEGRRAVASGNDGEWNAFKIWARNWNAELTNNEQKKVLYRKKAVWILELNASLIAKLFSMLEAGAGGGKSYKESGRALLLREREICEVLNKDRGEFVKWAGLSASGKKVFESLRADTPYKNTADDVIQQLVCNRLFLESSHPSTNYLVIDPNYKGYQFRGDSGEPVRLSEIYEWKSGDQDKILQSLKFINAENCAIPPILDTYCLYEPVVLKFDSEKLSGGGKLFINSRGDVISWEMTLKGADGLPAKEVITRRIGKMLNCFKFVPAFKSDGFVAVVLNFNFVQDEEHPNGIVTFNL
jgi:hypothetical protein